jgi:enamine deaminase RidA (YjgF/YER057c/UK114 family)
MSKTGPDRRLISSGSPYEALAGYSRAVVQGNWCFVAGTTGADPESQIMPDDVAEQAANSFTNIIAALGEAGFELGHVVRATYYITDAAYFEAILPVLSRHFGEIRPAATCVVVAGLVDPAMKIEIEVTALRG